MQTAAERLDFVLRFVNMDLEHLRQGDWLNLREDFAAFIGEHKSDEMAVVGPVCATPWPPSRDFSSADFQSLQAETQKLLTRLRGGDSEHKVGRVSPNSLALSVGLLPVVSEAPKPSGVGRSALLWLSGPPRDLFLMLIACLFAFESTAGVAQCPECKRFLLRSKKRQYCSARCQSRAYMRRYRQPDAVKERESAKAHARYAKRVKQQSGEKVQVGRRPRRKGGVSQ